VTDCLQKQGFALLNLVAKPDGMLYTNTVARLSSLRYLPLPQHSISRGDHVLLSTGTPTQDCSSAIVVDVAARWIRVALSNAEAGDVMGPGFRLDLAADMVALERTTHAIETFQTIPPNDDPSQRLRRCDEFDRVCTNLSTHSVTR
jgi:hypothetical protein